MSAPEALGVARRVVRAHPRRVVQVAALVGGHRAHGVGKGARGLWRAAEAEEGDAAQFVVGLGIGQREQRVVLAGGDKEPRQRPRVGAPAVAHRRFERCARVAPVALHAGLAQQRVRRAETG